jgi:hypothetical protein
MVRFYFMRTVARLSLFYFFAFFFFLAAGTSVSVMGAWLSATKEIGSVPFPLLSTVFTALTRHIHPAVYGSALLVLPSAVKRGLGSFTTGMTVLVLAAAVLFGGTYAARMLEAASQETPWAIVPPRNLSSDGLIADLDGRTLAYTGTGAVDIVPGQKMNRISDTEAAALFDRWERNHPQLGGIQGTSLASLSGDFAEGAARLNGAYDAGWEALLAYSCALALLLSSFSPLAGATRWPLADLMLCALAFRGVLILERLASSGPIVRFIAGGDFGVPERFAAQALLGLFGLILATGGTLFRLALRGNDNND